MYRVAVIGDRDSIYGFAALGLDVNVIEYGENPSQKFCKLCESNYAVIYVTEALATQLTKEIEHYNKQRTPAIILIPGVSGNTGEGISAVNKSVEKAVGSDIIFNN